MPSVSALPLSLQPNIPKVLPNGLLPDENLWLEQNPYITVPADDIFYVQDCTPGAQPVVMIAPDGAGPLLVDLHATLGSVACLDPFNEPMQSSLRRPRCHAAHVTARRFAGGWAETCVFYWGMQELRHVDTDMA
jgi:hypothetical protein